MPSERFTHTARTTAPRSEVWASLDLPETWEGIAGVDRIYNAVFDADGRLQSFDFDTQVAGKAYVGKAVTTERAEGSSMTLDIENSDIKGAIAIGLADAGDGTDITVGLDVASKGMMAGMFFGVIARTIGSGLPRTVEDMAARMG